MATGDDLRGYRAEIDGIDEDLVRLLNERAEVAAAIGRIKRELGLPLPDPAREAQVLAHASEANDGPFSDAAMRRIFGAIIAETLAIEDAREPLGGG